jgi:hypothetical protein
VAAPSGDAKAYIYMRDERWSTWIETSSIQVDMANRFVPILGDDFALSTMAGPSGTFQGTIGEPA